MCIAVPGEIIDISNTQAIVNIMGIETTVNIQLISRPQIGDHLLIHAGCAIEKIDIAYAKDLTNIFESMIDKEESYE